jgi:hypothetical protein
MTTVDLSSRNTLLLYARKRVDEAIAPLKDPAADHTVIDAVSHTLTHLRLHFARLHIAIGAVYAEQGEVLVDILEAPR